MVAQYRSRLRFISNQVKRSRGLSLLVAVQVFCGVIINSEISPFHFAPVDMAGVNRFVRYDGWNEHYFLNIFIPILDK